jgi:hypothetical protein
MTALTMRHDAAARQQPRAGKYLCIVSALWVQAGTEGHLVPAL